MRLTIRARGIGPRIAAAVVVTSVVGIALLAFGVWILGGLLFERLMAEHGVAAAEAHAMFDQSVTVATALAALGAIAIAIVVGSLLARRLSDPLQELGLAARRIAAGNYAARVPRAGPEEIASLADSFNQMATAIEEQERLRREFIANAAHELRTPLTNLTGYLEALRDGVVAAEPATFESLLEETERLVRLSHGLDTLAQGDAAVAQHRLVDIDLASIIRAALDLVRPGVDKARIDLTTDLPDRLAARGDPDGLAQVIGNLLQNAIRYTPAGGRISVRAEQRPGHVLVAVANTGDGIPAADLPHVFERFYRVDKSRDRASGGGGIGLAIVQQLVEAAGGRVGVDSAPGLTRFWFSLPA